MDNQVSIFDGNKKFKIDKPVRLIELFAGIGAQAKALENLGIDFEHYRICEFDKYAVTSYNAVHDTNFATSDITKITADDLGIVDTDKYCYVMTYSFPCQDLSLAGKQRGMEKGAGTRSGLLWEVERLLDECKELPQVLIMENVPQVIGTKNIEHFAKWQEKLESLGYKNKWQILNAKDFGIPQNRERCFMVSILGDYYYEFPKTMKLDRRLKDLLENEVDEKYYLSDKMIEYFEKHSKECEDKGSGFRFNPVENTEVVAKAVTTRAGGRMDDNFIKLHELTSGQSQGNRVYDSNGLSVTLSANGGGLGAKTGLYMVQRPHGYNKGKRFDNECPTITTSSFQENNFVVLDEQNGYIRKDGCVGTLTTDGSSPKHNNRIIVKYGSYYTWPNNQGNINTQCNRASDVDGYSLTIPTCETPKILEPNYRIRKLTPKECWRLMGFADADFDKAQATGMSNAQLYKQAGNSIVVNVLVEIFRGML